MNLKFSIASLALLIAVAPIAGARNFPKGGFAPLWVSLGNDLSGRHIWLRLVRDDDYTFAGMFANGRLVKQKSFITGNFLVRRIPITVAQIGRNWLVFFDGNPGAGSTWYTNCLTINRKSFGFAGLKTFEHGDATEVNKHHRFVEYCLTKYNPKYHYLYPRISYYRRVWDWSEANQEFDLRPGSQLLRDVPSWTSKAWGDDGPVDSIVPDEVQFTNLQPFGFSKGTGLAFMPFYGFGAWTVGLMRKAETLAGADLPIGNLDMHNPPKLTKGEMPGVAYLTFGSYGNGHVTRYYIRLTNNPHRIEVLHTRVENEWTPFSH